MRGAFAGSRPMQPGIVNRVHSGETELIPTTRMLPSSTLTFAGASTPWRTATVPSPQLSATARQASATISIVWRHSLRVAIYCSVSFPVSSMHGLRRAHEYRERHAILVGRKHLHRVKPGLFAHAARPGIKLGHRGTEGGRIKPLACEIKDGGQIRRTATLAGQVRADTEANIERVRGVIATRYLGISAKAAKRLKRSVFSTDAVVGILRIDKERQIFYGQSRDIVYVVRRIVAPADEDMRICLVHRSKYEWHYDTSRLVKLIIRRMWAQHPHFGP